MNQMNVWGMTDIGLVRKENQDAYVTAQHTASGRTVGVVCDGMGGPAGGRVASQIAVHQSGVPGQPGHPGGGGAPGGVPEHGHHPGLRHLL